MSTIRDMVDSIGAGQQIDVAAIIRDALTDKALEQLSVMKTVVAQHHFNTEAITSPYSTVDASKTASKRKQTSSTTGSALKPTFSPAKLTVKSSTSNEAQ